MSELNLPQRAEATEPDDGSDAVKLIVQSFQAAFSDVPGELQVEDTPGGVDVTFLDEDSPATT